MLREFYSRKSNRHSKQPLRLCSCYLLCHIFRLCFPLISAFKQSLCSLEPEISLSVFNIPQVFFCDSADFLAWDIVQFFFDQFHTDFFCLR